MSLEPDRTAPIAAARDRHLFAGGPKRILAIDGGGVRAALALAFIEEIEALLAARAGRMVRICDYFDLIGGTSAGAILAAGLALGYTASQVRQIYVRISPAVFRGSFWRLPGLQAKFDARRMVEELRHVVGGRTLDTPDLQTGLAVVMKRMDTASPWVVANNPRGAFWESPSDHSYVGNRHYSLASLLRASSAAPFYFDPELVTIVDGEAPGLFVDGGLTPHNNPALQMLMMALLDGYGLRWAAGADNLLIVSVGTGSHRPWMTAGEAAGLSTAGLAVRALTSLMDDTTALAYTLLHWLSGTPARWPLNAELGRLAGQVPPFGAGLLSFRRYDVQLEAAWLARELDQAVDTEELRRLWRMDDHRCLPRLYELGRIAAARFVCDEDFPAAFDGGLVPPPEVSAATEGGDAA